MWKEAIIISEDMSEEVIIIAGDMFKEALIKAICRWPICQV